MTTCDRMEERLASYRLRNTMLMSPFRLRNVRFFNPLLAKCLQAVDFAVSISTRHKKGRLTYKMSLPETLPSWSRGR